MSKLVEQKTHISHQANLVLAGGGLYASTARPLLEFGLGLSDKDTPNVLLVPTAKNKEQAFNLFSRKAQKMYGEDIGTPVEMLHEFQQMPSKEELQAKFDTADVLYISGGSTRHAMQLWKEHGIDEMLTDAMRKGKIITGISAGAIAWFSSGFSDSESYDVEKGEPWDFTEVEGLGHIELSVSPHFNSTETPDGKLRSEHFMNLLQKKSEESGKVEFGLGIDNDVALVATNGLVKIVRSNPDADMYVVSVSPDGVRTQSPIEAPRFEVTADNHALNDAQSEGITWEDFYLQLTEPAKSPQGAASASSKVS